MKTYITLIISLLIFSSLHAQTENCVSDEVQGVDPTSCCNDLIITAPINPVNTERPNLLNQFDWLALTTDLSNPQTLEVNNGSTIPVSAHPFLVHEMPRSWFSSFTTGQMPPFDSHDMHPRYGWELMHMNLGLGLYGDTETISGQPNPYMLFYNKYTGKLRLVVSPSVTATSFDNANVDLKIINDPNASLASSALLNRYNSQQKALDQSTIVTNISSHLPFASLSNWSVADFQLAYDPCTCNLPSRIAFDFTERNFSEVNMTGRLVGTIVPLASSGNSPLNFGDDFLSSVFVDGFFEGNKDNVGMLVYDQVEEDVTSAYVNPVMKALSSALTLAAGFIPGGPSIDIPFEGLDTLEIPIKAVASGAVAFASKQINPPAPKISYLESELAITGTIDDVINSATFADFELLSPGSFVTDHSAFAWDLHPFYNELPGLFALLKTPDMQFANSHGGTTTNNPTVEGGGGLSMSIKDPLEYTLNPAAEIDIETSEIYAAIEFDVYFPTVEMTNLSSYLENLPPTFTLAAAEFIANSQIIDRFPQLGGLTDPNSNLSFLYDPQETGARLTFQTTYVPIDRMDDFRFEERFEFLDINHYSTLGINQFANHQELFNFRLKIFADYTFMPNVYGETNESVQVYTYEFGEINEVLFIDMFECDEDPNNYSDPSICDTELYNQYDYQENLTLNTTHFTQSQDIYAGTITIVGDLTTAPGVTVNLYAATEIWTPDLSAEFPNNFFPPSVSPNINLIIREMYPHESINTVSQVDLKAFCNGSEYKASSAQLAPPQSENKEDITLDRATIEHKLYPNPADDILNFYLKLDSDADVNVRVLDLSGSELGAFRISEQWEAGEYLRQVQTKDLPAGLLLFEICVDGNCTTEKLSIVH